MNDEDVRTGTTGTFLIGTMLDVEAVFLFESKVVVVQCDGTVTEIGRR